MKVLNICNTSLCAQTVIITEMLQFDLFLTATPLLHLVFHCLVALIDGSNQYLMKFLVSVFHLQTQCYWSSIQPSEPIQGGGWSKYQYIET